jgi:ABC-2 type transport system permease protein
MISANNPKSQTLVLKLKRLWDQCAKELAQFRRDRLILALTFLLPLMSLLILGFAIRLETKDIPLAVQDFDHSPLSRTYTERLFATNQFQPASWSGSDPVRDAIDRNSAKAAVVIPPGFARRIKAGKTSTVQILVDATDVNNARVIKSSINSTTIFFLRSVGLPSSIDRVVGHIRIWFNPGRKESLYIVPGAYAVILWMYPALLAALAMVREKEQGTIIQIYASSISAVELLLGKGLAYLLVALSQTLWIMVLGSLFFGLRLVGDPTPLLISTPIFLITSVLFGLFVGVRVSTQSAAAQGVSTVSFLTALLLSGFIYPVSNIPFPLSLVSNFVPARYYIELTRNAFVQGGGWASVWSVPLVLALLGLLLFYVAWLGLHQMQLPE